jgi:hypothetical protein
LKRAVSAGTTSAERVSGKILEACSIVYVMVKLGGGGRMMGRSLAESFVLGERSWQIVTATASNVAMGLRNVPAS